jgi:hypothetical protein
MISSWWLDKGKAVVPAILILEYGKGSTVLFLWLGDIFTPFILSQFPVRVDWWLLLLLLLLV